MLLQLLKVQSFSDLNNGAARIHPKTTMTGDRSYKKYFPIQSTLHGESGLG